MVSIEFTADTKEEDDSHLDMCKLNELLQLFNDDRKSRYLGDPSFTHEVLELTQSEKKKYGVTIEDIERANAKTIQIVERKDNMIHADEHGFFECYNKTIKD